MNPSSPIISISPDIKSKEIAPQSNLSEEVKSQGSCPSFDISKLNKRDLKEYDKSTHILCPLKKIDKGLVSTVAEITSAHIIHLSDNREVFLMTIKKSKSNSKSSILSKDSGEKEDLIQICEVEFRKLTVPFECFTPSTVFALTKGSNPGIYAIHANNKCDEFYYYPTSEATQIEYNVSDWELLQVDSKNVKYSSTCYDGKDSIYITGGCDLKAYNHAYIFDTKSQRIINLKNMNEQRHCHSSYLLNNEGNEGNRNMLYVFGGLMRHTEQLILSIERLNLGDLSNSWELIRLDTKQGEAILISSLILSISQGKFILLGGSCNKNSVPSSQSLELEITENEENTSAIAHKTNYFMKKAESFSNRVLFNKNYLQIGESIIIIGDSSCTYQICEKEVISIN